MNKWTELTDDQEILDIVSGYQLDFSEIPHQRKPPTPFNFSKEEERLVDLEVEKLLRKGAIEEVEPCEKQFLSNIFMIPKKGGERRPVVDIRDLNNFIKPVHFKMEDLSHLPSVLRRGGFYVQDRLKRRISNHSDCKKIKDLPMVSMERETLPVHMSTFRPQILSKNFHKGSETPLGLPQSSGSSTAGVFRRHTYHGSNPRATCMSGAYAADMAVVDRFKFSGKPKSQF